MQPHTATSLQIIFSTRQDIINSIIYQNIQKVESKLMQLSHSNSSRYHYRGPRGQENVQIGSVLQEKKIDLTKCHLQQHDVQQKSQTQKNPEKQFEEQRASGRRRTRIISINQTIPKPSQTVVFFKQHYETLFYSKNPKFPNIEKILFQFYNKKQQKQNDNPSSGSFVRVSVIGTPSNQKVKSKIVVEVGTNYPKSQYQKQLQLDYQIIPNDQKDPVKAAKILLQKKIWIQVSAMLDGVSVYNQSENNRINIPLGLTKHTSWVTQENVFNLDPSKNVQDFIKSTLYQLDTLKISYHLSRQSSFDRDTLNDCNTIKVMQIGKIFNPVLAQNPSLLTNQANKYLLTNEILALYEYLRTLQINQLPRLGAYQSKFQQKSYYQWRCLRAAIDKSIKTKPAYLNVTRNNKKYRQPIGIMNAIMIVKTIDISKDMPNTQDIFRWTQFDWSKNPNFQECMKQIYEKRSCYVRLELQENDATGIGGNIVLQVWPPHCCSPIHNHGETFGLIKVLANEICVQNFNDLNFLNRDQKPYQSVIYQEGQYTWLSEYSYGIHRLINPTSHLTLSLQAYMGSKGSKQYFEFIADPTAPLAFTSKYKESSQKQYIEYYPQNDWRNFLDWPNIVSKNQQWMKIDIIKTLHDYIVQVKQYYKLSTTKDATWDFPHLVLVMKQQYEIYDNLYNQTKEQNRQQVKISVQMLEK